MIGFTSSRFDWYLSNTDAKVAISYFNKKMCGHLHSPTAHFDE